MSNVRGPRGLPILTNRTQSRIDDVVCRRWDDETCEYVRGGIFDASLIARASGVSWDIASAR